MSRSFNNLFSTSIFWLFHLHLCYWDVGSIRVLIPWSIYLIPFPIYLYLESMSKSILQCVKILMGKDIHIKSSINIFWSIKRMSRWVKIYLRRRIHILISIIHFHLGSKGILFHLSLWKSFIIAFFFIITQYNAGSHAIKEMNNVM